MAKAPFRFAAIGLDHRHIYHQAGRLLELGCEYAGYWTEGAPQPFSGFLKRFPDLRRVDDPGSLMEDPSIDLIVSAAIPDERSRIAIQAMRNGKDVMVDKPGVVSLTQLREIERSAFATFFQKVIALDGEQRVFNAIWDIFCGPIRILMHNKYVFHAFWQYHNGISGFDNWEEQSRASERRFLQALRTQDTARVLSLVFDRLYGLRNQIVHGGSTWNSSVNREQVRDGTAILEFLMPVFVDVMMDNPDEQWGRPFYPVVG